MNIWERVVIDIATNEVIEATGYAYTGHIAEMKGDQSKKVRRLAEQREQEFFQQMMRNLGDVRSGVLQFLTPEGQGFTPSELAALNAQAIEAVPARFEDLEQRLRTELARRGAIGGNIPISGDFARDFGSLAAEKEKFRTELLRDVMIRDALLKNQNRFNAANALLGVGSQFTGAQQGSLGIQQQAAQAADQASSGFLGALVGGGLGALGSFLGGPFFGRNR